MVLTSGPITTTSTISMGTTTKARGARDRDSSLRVKCPNKASASRASSTSNSMVCSPEASAGERHRHDGPSCCAIGTVVLHSEPLTEHRYEILALDEAPGRGCKLPQSDTEVPIRVRIGDAKFLGTELTMKTKGCSTTRTTNHRYLPFSSPVM
jgi:hypothetical protein